MKIVRNAMERSKRLLKFIFNWNNLLQVFYWSLFHAVIILSYFFSFNYLMYTIYRYNPKLDYQKQFHLNFEVSPPRTNALILEGPNSPDTKLNNLEVFFALPDDPPYEHCVARFHLEIVFLNSKSIPDSSYNHSMYREVVVPYKSQVPRMFMKVFLLPFYLVGLLKDEIHLRVSFLDDVHDIQEINSVLSKLSHFFVSVNTPELLVYKSIVHFHSEIGGWRYYVFYYPIFSFILLLTIVWGIISLTYFIVVAFIGLRKSYNFFTRKKEPENAQAAVEQENDREEDTREANGGEEVRQNVEEEKEQEIEREEDEKGIEEKVQEMGDGSNDDKKSTDEVTSE